jgi:hypothetical protein
MTSNPGVEENSARIDDSFPNLARRVSRPALSASFRKALLVLFWN